MWPSQNFLLYNETSIMEMIKKNLIYIAISPSPFAIHVPRTNYNYYQYYFNFKKEQTILKPLKYNHKCKKEINIFLPDNFLS